MTTMKEIDFPYSQKLLPDPFAFGSSEQDKRNRKSVGIEELIESHIKFLKYNHKKTSTQSTNEIAYPRS